MTKLGKIIALGLLFWVSTPMLFAQDDLPTDDLGNVSDAFQEAFFEALKQKGIQNYEKALELLEQAQEAAKDNVEQQAVVFYQKGKNYYALKKFQEAEQWYLKSKAIDDNTDIVVSLYDVYYQTREYDKAIEIVKELIVFDGDYKEDLANLFARTQQYDKALTVLDELDTAYGRSTYRENLRKQIIRETGDSSSEIGRLEQKVATNAANEADFLNLIYFYSDAGDSEKAFQAAQQMLEFYPDSELVHLALYKFYIDQNEPEKAVSSMQLVMNAKTIDTESKLKVMSDFLNFANKKPEYNAAVEEALADFASWSSNPRTLERIGAYYLERGEQEKSLTFFERAARLEPDNFSLLKNTLLLQIDTKKYNEALSMSEVAIEIFPTQALLYLIKGVALIQTNDAQEAVAILEEGIDYVVDDTLMEKDFYQQLSLAYEQLNNVKKAQEYAKKVKDLG